VLFRENYPQNLNDLKASIQRALKRLDTLKLKSNELQFQNDSLLTAQRNLEQFLNRIPALFFLKERLNNFI